MVFFEEIILKELIYIVRNKQVMVDSDLAMLYQVETKALNRAVKRNIKRFPEDFCFQLTTEEAESLKCQSGTSKIQESEKRMDEAADVHYRMYLLSKEYLCWPVYYIAMWQSM